VANKDFNNARAFDFTQPDHPKVNRLNRTTDSRMGWTDPSICLEGPVVQDLLAHFVQRWNFEYALKYGAGPHHKYHLLALESPSDNIRASTALENPDSSTRRDDEQKPIVSTAPGAEIGAEKEPLRSYSGDREVRDSAGIFMQLVRSVSQWSHGTPTEVRYYTNPPSSTNYC
jgi:phospholipase D1/2